MSGSTTTIKRAPPVKISALVSDVDGTLITSEKRLSPRTLASVAELGLHGIVFSIISSRPPRGLRHLVEQMTITAPMAAFNGGVLLTPKLEPIEENLLAPTIAQWAVEELTARGADVWLFSGSDWFVRNGANPYVQREVRALQFEPVIVQEFDTGFAGVAKIVGISADLDLIEKCEREIGERLSGAAAVVRSQVYALDITHPRANKGVALARIADRMSIPLAEIAVIGDGGNDVAMFAPSGLSVAMGNAALEVRRAADYVTGGNDEDGFAEAVDRFILGVDRPAVNERRGTAGS